MHIHRFLFLFNFYYMLSAYHFGGVYQIVPRVNRRHGWYRNLIILYTKKKNKF